MVPTYPFTQSGPQPAQLAGFKVGWKGKNDVVFVTGHATDLDLVAQLRMLSL